ncbi:hypothetical protein F383_27686 [Gossypium arboreum]|uniref:Uncharacterized protein n=1 Tax=Gossypium arboreum TaxID=29729 RepID=A0A0B0PDH0_GOSAR|nr:hypothetical protein F383_27686 [Gossypium arboreum]
MVQIDNGLGKCFMIMG